MFSEVLVSIKKWMPLFCLGNGCCEVTEVKVKNIKKKVTGLRELLSLAR